MGRLRKDREDTRSNGGLGGHLVGPAGTTLPLAGAPSRVLTLLFWKLPPPPLLMHLSPWLS